MHDRRVNGEALTFGNQGALFMRAMTWWDRETHSVWSQPWGSAILGELEGTALTLIPGAIVPWDTWLEEHPDTTVLTNDLQGRFPPVEAHDEFVIGVAIKDTATAYYYEDASELRVINDSIGETPVVVFVDPDTRDIKVYLRKTGALESQGQETAELTFAFQNGVIVDIQTNSVWEADRGVATEGRLKGTILQQIPFVSSFDWAWEDFFPHTSFYDADAN